MSDLSPLEVHFPRLVADIQAVWRSPESFGRLQELLVDGRGGRQGFPEAVYSDLATLLSLLPRPKGPYDIWSEALDADGAA